MTKVQLLKKVFATNKDKCVYCHLCVAACPVKAIKLSLDTLEIDDTTCIYCGHCWQACRTGAITINSEASVAEKIIAARPTVALITSETFAAFEQVQPGQLMQALKELGFIAVEESLLGEEIVAHHYLKHFTEANSPAIRSTCPAVVNLIEMYYPEYLSLLMPLANPILVQARLIKLLYPDSPAVISIGPCTAQKRLASPKSELDLSLTFTELKELFQAHDIDPKKLSNNINSLTVKRTLSAPGGFPMTFLNYKGSGALIVEHSLKKSQEALANLTSSTKKRFLDLLACDGCLNGPAFPPEHKLSRLKLIQEVYAKNNFKPSFNWQSLVPKKLDVSYIFQPKPVKSVEVAPELLNKLLLEVGLTPNLQINCGLCGYETCLKQAKATLLGYSSWTSCIILQRSNFQKTTEELLKTSSTDPLTGLTNHRGFMNALISEFNRFKRYKLNLTVMMIDVDFFKEVNDRYGHLIGDRVLKLTAQIFATCLRETDVAARYGGDEFAIILPETELAEGLKVAEKLRAQAGSVCLNADKKIEAKISLSIGVAQAEAKDNEAMCFLKRVDEALYQAKQQGRNRVVAATGSC